MPSIQNNQCWMCRDIVNNRTTAKYHVAHHEPLKARPKLSIHYIPIDGEFSYCLIALEECYAGIDSEKICTSKVDDG